MSTEQMMMDAIYAGWEEYQHKLIQAIAPLSADQLALRAAPTLRSIEGIAAHMVGARARWFHNDLGERGAELEAFTKYDRPGMGAHTASELVRALEATWKIMAEARARWTPAEWARTWPGEEGDPAVLTPYYVIWHLIEHDLHHGGEISLTLGMHNLAAPDL